MNRDGSAPRRPPGEDAEAAAGRPERPGDGRVEELTFCMIDLPEVRDFVALRARRSGIPDDALGDLLVAVNEVATNAVTHGTAKACLSVWTTSGLFVIEVHDDGHWIPAAPPGRTPPGDFAISGMGLWVSSLLSDVIHFGYGPEGTTVTMGFSVPSAKA